MATTKLRSAGKSSSHRLWLLPWTFLRKSKAGSLKGPTSNKTGKIDSRLLSDLGRPCLATGDFRCRAERRAPSSMSRLSPSCARSHSASRPHHPSVALLLATSSNGQPTCWMSSGSALRRSRSALTGTRSATPRMMRPSPLASCTACCTAAESRSCS